MLLTTKRTLPLASSPWSLALALLVSPLIAFLCTPTAHTLQIRTASWFSLWLLCVSRAGLGKPWESRAGRSTAYTAGLLLALGHICERTAGQSEVDWVKAILPFALHLVSSVWPDSTELRPPALALLSCSAFVCTYHIAGRNPATTLGLLYAALLPIALRLLDRAAHQAASDGLIYSTTSVLLKQPEQRQNSLLVLRDVSFVAALFCLPLAIVCEPWRWNGLSYNRLFGDLFGTWWLMGQPLLILFVACFGGAAQMIADGAMVHLVQTQSYSVVALILAAGSVFGQCVVNFAPIRLWFAAIFAATLYSTHQTKDRSRILAFVTAISLLLYAATWFLEPAGQQLRSIYSSSVTSAGSNQPLKLTDTSTHPIAHLLSTAQREWSKKLQSQSKTLESAVQEYRRRYGLSPPPHFDRWYEYAVSRDVQMIDEYDTIYHSLLPFWGVSPALLRLRLQEAIGNRENNLIAVNIRGKKAVNIEGGKPWQQQATIGMLDYFVEHLPDMDLALNVHDEPRVLLPHDGLARLVARALDAIAHTPNTPIKYFSPRPADMTSGDRIEEVKTSRFNTFAHQRAWGLSKMSCPPDSPARAYDESMPVDNLTSYALTDVGFIYNQTAFSDICNSPSFSTSHGFFERPNAFSVVHDLVPIFSQSKMSSFQDILYPSPWYWYEKVRYSESSDVEWEEKNSQLYWRGTTTGGFARDGGWRRQHRQQIVRMLNAQDQAVIMANSTVRQVDRHDFSELVNVKFTKVGQCDPLDCKAQKEFFPLAPNAEQTDAWLYRYLLDLDGNAFSGRFYAFLQSRSLTLKMAVFREWHQDWIAPWVHYIPLSLRGTEILEAVRWFVQEPDGQQESRRIAQQSSQWAAQSLRDADLEAYFFRLLLEYARVLDDNRASIGFA